MQVTNKYYSYWIALSQVVSLKTIHFWYLDVFTNMSLLGFNDEMIQLVEYQKSWDYRFQFDSAMLLLALGEMISGIEHIGQGFRHV